MKTPIRLSLILLCLAVLCLCAVSVALADNIASGSCGNGLTWTLDSEGTLTVSGEGELVSSVQPAEPYGYPWAEYAQDICKVIIEEGVTGIDRYAFYDFTGITSLAIPSTTERIDWDAVITCSSLTAITVDANNPSYCDIDGVVFDKGLEEVLRFPQNRKGTYTIPEGVTRIGDIAFAYCKVESVALPSTLTAIGYASFFGCRDITEIVIPDGVTNIGFEAFRFCTSLADIMLPKALNSVPAYVFDECGSLTVIDIPPNVRYIGNCAFRNCVSLTEIGIPARLRTILYDAFENCGALSLVRYKGTELSWSQLDIGEGNDTFLNAEVVISFPGVSGTWGNLAWTLDDSGTLTISGSGEMDSFRVYTEGGSFAIILRAWHDYSPLIRRVVIGNGVTSVGQHAFEGCRSLEEVVIPDTVATVDESAFCYCTSLSEITLPDGVCSIEATAFDCCSGLTRVTIPASVTSIADYAFSSCGSLAEVRYCGSLDQWNAIQIGSNNDALLSADIRCVGMPSPDLILPASLTSIAGEAFAGSAFSCVQLSEKTVEIGPRAFANCPNLEYVYIPAATVSIAEDAFSDGGSPIIYGKKGSRAETFATEQGLLFIERDP